MSVYSFNLIASQNRESLALNPYEVLHTRMQLIRILIFILVPLASVLVVFLLRSIHVGLASMLGGKTYLLYTPLMIFWIKIYNAKVSKLKESSPIQVINNSSS